MTTTDHANALAFARAFAKGELEEAAKASCKWCSIAGPLGSVEIERAHDGQHAIIYSDGYRDSARCNAEHVWVRIAGLEERLEEGQE